MAAIRTTRSTSCWWMISRPSCSAYEVILQDLGENLIKATSGKEALEATAQATRSPSS